MKLSLGGIFEALGSRGFLSFECTDMESAIPSNCVSHYQWHFPPIHSQFHIFVVGFDEEENLQLSPHGVQWTNCVDANS